VESRTTRQRRPTADILRLANFSLDWIGVTKEPSSALEIGRRMATLRFFFIAAEIRMCSRMNRGYCCRGKR
jgi:hypothetical protein